MFTRTSCRLPVALFLTVISAGACAPAGPAGLSAPPAPRAAPLAAAELVRLREVVRAREAAFAQTMAARDLAAFGTFVSEEGVFFGAAPLRGRQQVVAAWSQFFEGPEAPFSWTPALVEVLPSGTLALTSGPVTGRDGKPAGSFNSIWRLEADGVWRVVFDKGT